jgi:2-polyprenyl-6-methoxyphenol hydroxylase-like FAD-dependent oxidoreductase
MLLARAGARVLVLERDAPGTDTLSTHALMRGGVMQLARWGLLPRLLAAGTPAVRRTTFGYGPERVDLDIRPAHGIDALYAPRRTVLDPILATAAGEAGAEMRFRAAVVRLLRRAGRIAGVEAVVDGRRVEIAADLVIGADGRRSTVARQVAAPTEVAGAHAAAVVYAYAEGLENRGYRWDYAPGVGVGAIPTNGRLHCVFASLPPERFRTEVRRDPTRALLRLLAEASPELAAELAPGQLVTRPAALAGEAGWLRRSHGPGWALVGDAGYFKDPITAHGITDALRDAEILARTVLAGEGLARYQQARDAVSLPLFRVTDAIAGFAWDLPRLQALHLELHRAMKAEQDWLATAWTGLPRAA